MKSVPIYAIKKAFLMLLYENTVEKKTVHPLIMFRLAAAKKYLPAQALPVDVEVTKNAISELVRDGYLKPKDSTYTLTKKGLDQTTKPFEKMKLSTMDIFPLISSNYRLLKAVHNDYIEGDFESVVFKSFKLLEESVREKAKLTANDYGKDLMIKAFKPQVGRLVCPSAETNAEQDSLLDMMKGAIGFYKNPKSHRTVVIDDPDKVIRIAVLAKLLLDALDECESRPPAKPVS
jgi:uncharacterized protein (TIGR02391 family)